MTAAERARAAEFDQRCEDVAGAPGRLIAAGDQLQSAASRLAEWVIECGAPYEVYMAALEAQTAISAWTEARVNRGQPATGPVHHRLTDEDWAA